MSRALFAFALMFAPIFGYGQVPFPQLSQPITTFSQEAKDWGIEATTTPKQAAHNPTPTAITGARIIKTVELQALLAINKSVVVIDVLDAKSRNTIPGAFWMPGAGDGRFFDVEKRRFTSAVLKLTNGDKARPIVFLCANSECWLSYNAALYAVEAGFTDVIWYRGGTSAWMASNVESAKSISW